MWSSVSFWCAFYLWPVHIVGSTDTIRIRIMRQHANKSMAQWMALIDLDFNMKDVSAFHLWRVNWTSFFLRCVNLNAAERIEPVALHFFNWNINLFFRNIQRMHHTISITLYAELYMKIYSMTMIACHSWILLKGEFSIGMLHWELLHWWTAASTRKYRSMAIKSGEINIILMMIILLGASYHVLNLTCKEFSNTN